MTRPVDAKRVAHFRRHHLLWLALAHFLSADLLRELVMAVTEAVGRDAADFDRLFDEQIDDGPAHLATWIVKPRPCDDPVGVFLQDVARHLGWRNDVPPFRGGPDDEAASVKQPIDAALALGLHDLESIITDAALPEPLSSLATAMRSLADAPDRASWEPPEWIKALEAPLPAVLLKHLGDLCIDADDWGAAGILYRMAGAAIPARRGPWKALVAALGDMLAQSQGAAAWGVSGPEAALAVYGAVEEAPVEHPLLSANGDHDRLVAHAAAGEGLRLIGDRRAVAAVAPQLVAAQDHGKAFVAWQAGNRDSANRWFWSCIRRHTALGSLSDVGALKVAYGHCLLDELREQLPHHRQPGMFCLAVRLLVQGGDADTVARVVWDEALLTAYLDDGAVQFAVACAQRAPGFQVRREGALVAIFRSWLANLPADSRGMAPGMLHFLAEGIRRHSARTRSQRNLLRDFMKALAEIGRDRPELARLAADEIVGALRKQLGAGPNAAVADAVETLGVYAAMVSDQELRASLQAVLEALGDPQSPADPRIVGPALDLLVDDASTAASAAEPELGRRVATTVLRLALARESEHARLLFLLRDQPHHLWSEFDRGKLDEIVRQVRSRAGQISTSLSAGNIQALLAAPGIVGPDGFADGLHALCAELESVAGLRDGRRQSLGFAYLWHAVIQLCQEADKLAADLKLDMADYRMLLEPIRDRLVAVWEGAPANPQVFAPFRLPSANAPHAAVVHNWAYASALLDQTLRPDGRLRKAMDSAVTDPGLGPGIASGRASRETFERPAEIDPPRLAEEPRGAFYGALGARLSRVGALPRPDRTAAVAALVHQCFRLGPNGLDAGAFVAALDAGLSGAFPADASLLDYQRRAEASRDLRLGLVPLVEALRDRHSSG